MPLGARDIMLVLRARNEASGIIRDVGLAIGALGTTSNTAARNMTLLGAGLTALGAGFIAAGSAGVDFFADVTMEAVEYRRQVALTLTQIDQVGVSMDDVGDIAKRVALEIPAPFEQMQESLYDIFSSMDVGLEGAEVLLREFSKGAVAGQVDIQAAARATIAIMNSFQIPVSDVSHVMDVQFQLVRKGVGTYKEFAAVIGRVTPSAVSAGQSIESLAGMLAFLTRNGQSAAMASVSAGRALDLLAKPESVKALEEMGVQVRDANGEFLQMTDIIRQLAEDKGWAKLTGPELKEAFKNTFGTGTVQARRFFDLAIPNFQQLIGLTDDMHDSAGAMDGAYDIMFEQPSSKIEQFKNRVKILREEIGEKFLPTLEKIVDVGNRLLDLWDQLSPETQTLIIKITVLASVLAIVVGTVLAVVGVFLIFAGAAAAAGVALSTIGLIVLGITAAFAALVVIAYVVITNWQTLVEWFNKAKDVIDKLPTAIKILLLVLAAMLSPIAAVIIAIVLLIKNFETIKRVAGEVFDFIKDKVVTAFTKIKEWIQIVIDKFNNELKPAVKNAMAEVRSKIDELIGWLLGTALPFVMYWVKSVKEQWDLLVAWWDEHVEPVRKSIDELWNAITERFRIGAGEIYNVMQTIWDVIQNVWGFIAPYIAKTMETIWTNVQFSWDIVQNIFKFAQEQIWGTVQNYWNQILTTIQFVLDLIRIFINTWGANIIDQFQIVWDTIVGVVQGALQVIRGIINIVTGIISGDWEKVWNGIVNVAQGVWNIIWAIISGALETIANFMRAVINGIAGVWGSSWDDIRQRLQNAWNAIWQVITYYVNLIRDVIKTAVDNWRSIFDSVSLYDIGKRIIQGLIDGLKAGFGAVKDTLNGLTAMLPSWKGPPSKDKVLLMNNGVLIMDGFSRGLEQGWHGVEKQLKGYNSQLSGGFDTNTAGPVGGLMTRAGVNMSAGAIQMTFYIDNATEDVQNEVQKGVQAALSQLTDDLAGFGMDTP